MANRFIENLLKHDIDGLKARVTVIMGYPTPELFRTYFIVTFLQGEHTEILKDGFHGIE